MANTRFSAELANRIRDDLVIEVNRLVSDDSNPVRALNVSEALYRYRKVRLSLLKYLEERKSD